MKRGIIRITPSDKNVKNIVRKIDMIIQANQDASAARLIHLLTPVIRGWTEYYKHLEIRERFITLDHYAADQLWKWALSRYSGVFKRRKAQQHFTAGPGGIRRLVDQEGQQLYCAQEVPRIPHVSIDPACNAYDMEWVNYLKQRQTSST